MASIIDIGTELLTQTLGSNIDPDNVKSALSGLLGDGHGGVGGLLNAAKSFLS